MIHSDALFPHQTLMYKQGVSRPLTYRPEATHRRRGRYVLFLLYISLYIVRAYMLRPVAPAAQTTHCSVAAPTATRRRSQRCTNALLSILHMSSAAQRATRLWIGLRGTTRTAGAMEHGRPLRSCGCAQFHTRAGASRCACPVEFRLGSTSGAAVRPRTTSSFKQLRTQACATMSRSKTSVELCSPHSCPRWQGR